jgi:hypothetical protein
MFLVTATRSKRFPGYLKVSKESPIVVAGLLNSLKILGGKLEFAHMMCSYDVFMGYRFGNSLPREFHPLAIVSMLHKAKGSRKVQIAPRTNDSEGFC